MRGPSLLALLFCVGCASTPVVPPRYAQPPVEMQRSGLGAWVILELNGGTEFAGELLATDPNQLFVLPERGTKWRAFDRLDVREVTLVQQRSSVGSVIAWSVLGAASSFSHGYYVVFSGPVWLISGIANSHQARAEAVQDLGPFDTSLREWARFPQGIPEGFVPNPR